MRAVEDHRATPDAIEERFEAEGTEEVTERERQEVEPDVARLHVREERAVLCERADEAVEEPGDPEGDDDPPVPPAPGQAIEPCWQVGLFQHRSLMLHLAA